MKFNVTAISIDRRTRRAVCVPRVELIDTVENIIFKGLQAPADIEARYEFFWNDTNPRSEQIVKVIDVEKHVYKPNTSVGTHLDLEDEAAIAHRRRGSIGRK